MRINHSYLFCSFNQYAEGILFPIIQIINVDIEKDWA